MGPFLPLRQCSETHVVEGVCFTKTGVRASPTKTGVRASLTKAGVRASPTKTGVRASPTKTGARTSPAKTRARASPTKTGVRARRPHISLARCSRLARAKIRSAGGAEDFREAANPPLPANDPLAYCASRRPIHCSQPTNVLRIARRADQSTLRTQNGRPICDPLFRNA